MLLHHLEISWLSDKASRSKFKLLGIVSARRDINKTSLYII